jgi:hypothetical protein
MIEWLVDIKLVTEAGVRFSELFEETSELLSENTGKY